MEFLYLESEKELDGIRERGGRRQTEPGGQAEEKKVEKGPGEAQRWSKPVGGRRHVRDCGAQEETHEGRIKKTRAELSREASQRSTPSCRNELGSQK